MSDPGTQPINVAEALAEIRQRVAARLACTVPEIPELAVPPLEPLRQARAEAEGWAAGLGVINPRPPGLHNQVIQGVKRLMARSLRWFAFPQIQFNGGVVAALVRSEEMFADINRNLVVLGQNIADRQRKEDDLENRLLGLFAAIQALSRSVERSIEQLSASLNRSVNQVSLSVSLSVDEVRADVNRLQDQFWTDFARYREEHSAIHAELQTIVDGELRLVRQRLRTFSERAAAPSALAVPPPASTASVPPPALDYPGFEERFRGTEEEIRDRQQFYLPILEGQAPVLDLACGRGELLELLRARGVECRGVDLDADMVELCRAKKLPVEQAEALAYLEAQPDGSLGAIFSAQFIEHLPAPDYLRLIRLGHAKLRRGGLLVLETQNPECLAIYSQTFFLDPTHVRPVPAAQLKFLLAEAGLTDLQVHYLSPVGDSLPQLPLWPENGGAEGPAAERWNRAAARFNRTYFGYMDYAIVGRKT